MKSIRHTILAALAKEPMIMDGLIDATGIDKHRIQDNMQAAIKEGLVDRSKDAVTGMLLYTITSAGKKRQAEGPQSKGGEAMLKKTAEKNVLEKTLLDHVEKKPASRANAIVPRYDEIDASVGDTVQESMPTADAALLASANRMLSERLAGVAHALRGSGLPAIAKIDDGEDLQQHVAALTGAYQVAMAQLDESVHQRDSWREMAATLDCIMPSDVLAYIKKIQRESIKSVTINQKERVFQGYACMVGGAEVYQNETAARTAAETALVDFPSPSGKSVAVVAIIARAVSGVVWKDG